MALARAVYQDKPVYLLDDIMSAVDRNVAKHIHQHCVMGLLASKTRLLCTHHTQYLVNADHIVVMEDGRITQQGKPSEVLQDFEDYFLPSDIESSLNCESMDCKKLLESESLSMRDTVDVSKAENSDSVLSEEGHETGSVDADVYCSYWRAAGLLLCVSILMSMLLMQTSRNMTDWWLSYWVSHSAPSNTTTHNVSASSSSADSLVLYLSASVGDNIGYYMMVYGLFVGCNTIFTLCRAFLFAYGGITAATGIHRQLLKSIMKVRVAAELQRCFCSVLFFSSDVVSRRR